MKVGILSLQGSFLDHKKSLNLVDINPVLIKNENDIVDLDGLILPGGESTAMTKIAENDNILSKLDEQIKSGVPTLSTCAGTILLAKKILDGNTVIPNIDIEVKRNFYGRQNESFEGDVQFLDNRDIYCFIRAPKITKLLNNNVKTIATHNSEIVGVSQKNIVSLTYHPELTNDDYYLQWLTQFLQEGKYVGSL